MILTVSGDNSIVSFALFEKGQEPHCAAPLSVFRVAAVPLRTADEYAVLLSSMIDRLPEKPTVQIAMIASVVPALTQELCRAIKLLLPQTACLTLGAGLRSGLTIRTETPADVGADLVAMAAGAAALQKPPFLVLHCGAVTTLSAIGEEKNGPAFLGCSILPGPSLGLDALKNRAALLPTVLLSRPRRAIGSTTGDSIRSGLLLGHAAAIKGLIAHFERELGGEKMPVIATGEEAELLLPLLEHDIRFDEQLTHRGLYRLALLNSKKSGNPPKRG